MNEPLTNPIVEIGVSPPERWEMFHIVQSSKI